MPPKGSQGNRSIKQVIIENAAGITMLRGWLLPTRCCTTSPSYFIPYVALTATL